jgi:hypothetical protein
LSGEPVTRLRFFSFQFYVYKFVIVEHPCFAILYFFHGKLHYRQSPETQLPGNYAPPPTVETAGEEPPLPLAVEIAVPVPQEAVADVPNAASVPTVSVIRERKGYGSEEIIACIL